MPFLARIAVYVFTVFTTLLSHIIALMGSRFGLASRQPCTRWFAFLSGTLASMTVFSGWCGVYGLGQAQPGLSGVLFGAFAGLVWGAIFSGVNSTVLWRAFNSENDDSKNNSTNIFETEINLLPSRIKESIKKFRFRPEFARTGFLPWGLYIAAIFLPALWSLAFCLLTFLTEGAPGVEPVIPLN